MSREQDDWDDFDDAGDGEAFVLPPFVRDPIGALKRRKLWMALALVAGLIGTGVYVGIQEPLYRGEARVLVTGQQISEDFIRPSVSEDAARTSTMIGEVLARNNLVKIIEKLDLYPDSRDKVPMNVLTSWLQSEISIYPTGGSRGRRGPTSQIYVVADETDDPETAAAVANELASLFVETSIKLRTQQARLTTDFLRRELEKAEQELREQDRKITEFNQTYRGELPGELGANLGKLERLQNRSTALRLQIEDVQARLRRLKNVEDPTSQQAQLTALKERLVEQLAIYTEEHPNVVTLRKRIQRLEAQLEKGDFEPTPMSPERTLQVQEDERLLARLREQYAQTDETIADLASRVDRTPQRQEELDALLQRERVLRNTYVEYMNKVQDAELAQSLESAQQGARVSMLERAEPSYEPVQPVGILALYGLGIALGLSLGMGVLLELLDPVIVSGEQLESLGDRPLLGSIPRVA